MSSRVEINERLLAKAVNDSPVAQKQLQQVVDDAVRRAKAAVPSTRVQKEIWGTARVEDGQLIGRVNAGAKGRGQKGFFAPFVEGGTVQLPARPFLRPAAKAAVEQVGGRWGEKR